MLAILQPAAFLAITVLARPDKRQLDPAAVALGMALVGLWGTAVWQAGNVLRFERLQGTLGEIVLRPVSLGTVLVGKSIGATLRSAIFIVPTVAIASLAAGHAIPVHDPLPFAAATVAVLASAAVLGMLLSCVFVLTRAAPRVAEALTYPVFILGGLVIPLSLLPSWARPLSVAISLRWGGELLRAASRGSPAELRAWVLLFATTAAYATLAWLLFERVLQKARRDGTLELH